MEHNDKNTIRIAFTSGIIASYFGYLSYRENFIKSIGVTYEIGLVTIFSLLTLMCFLYLLSLATFARYSKPGSIDVLNINPKVPEALYDTIIDSIFFLPLYYISTQIQTSLSRRDLITDSYTELTLIPILIVLSLLLKYSLSFIFWTLTFIHGRANKS